MKEKPKVYPYVVGEQERLAQQKRDAGGLDPARMDDAVNLFTKLRSTLEQAGVTPTGLTVRVSIATSSQSSATQK